MSRPKKDITRDKGLRIRLTQEEYEMIKYYAEQNNMSMSEVIRQSVLSTYEDWVTKISGGRNNE